VGELYERLTALEAAADLRAMRRELAELEAKESSPAFWEDAFGHSGMLVRRHRLNVEVRRLEILRGELDAVRELAEASFLEADDSVAKELTDAYARLDKRLARASRELVDFDATDQGDARVVISASGAGDGAEAWVDELAAMYAAWAKDRGFDVERALAAGTQEVFVLGAYAYGYLRGETGGHRILFAPPDRDDKRGITYLAKVEVLPSDVEPGSRPPVSDASPIRTYDQWRSHGVRDRLTGHVEGDVRRVLGGRLDGFLEAHMQKRPRKSADASGAASH
jgi:peptide chain release factor 2